MFQRPYGAPSGLFVYLTQELNMVLCICTQHRVLFLEESAMPFARGWEPVITGMWKFSGAVPVDQLAIIANHWLNGRDGHQYVDIHIRQCSKDQHGIGFKYVLPPTLSGEKREREYKKFFHGMRDKLRRQFGKNFVGWDVSSNTLVIK